MFNWLFGPKTLDAILYVFNKMHSEIEALITHHNAQVDTKLSQQQNLQNQIENHQSAIARATNVKTQLKNLLDV